MTGIDISLILTRNGWRVRMNPRMRIAMLGKHTTRTIPLADHFEDSIFVMWKIRSRPLETGKFRLNQFMSPVFVIPTEMDLKRNLNWSSMPVMRSRTMPVVRPSEWPLREVVHLMFQTFALFKRLWLSGAERSVN
jgi:hypothetical protein